MKKFKVITFKVYFNKYNYDRDYLAGIYDLLNKKTDYLKMAKIKTFLPNRSSVFNCISFYLSAPERKIQKLYKKIVKYIRDESKYINDLIEQMAKTDLTEHDAIFSNTKPPEIADVCMPEHICKKHHLTGKQKYIVPKLFKTKKRTLKSPPKKISPKSSRKRTSPKKTPSRSPKRTTPSRSSPKRTTPLRTPSRSSPKKTSSRSPKKTSSRSPKKTSSRSSPKR